MVYQTPVINSKMGVNHVTRSLQTKKVFLVIQNPVQNNSKTYFLVTVKLMFSHTGSYQVLLLAVRLVVIIPITV